MIIVGRSGFTAVISSGCFLNSGNPDNFSGELIIFAFQRLPSVMDQTGLLNIKTFNISE
jgi:hypothetical protein